MLRVSFAGGSGYVGGELLRLLLRHPGFELASVSSERHAGHYLHRVHPHLRYETPHRFVPLEKLAPADVLILALPHGRAAADFDRFQGLADRIVDCSADFRLDAPEAYARCYGEAHPRPELLSEFGYGLPELHRERLRDARYVSGVGCNATAVNLALMPLLRAGLVDADSDVFATVLAGSSEAGRSANAAGLHSERRGVIRSFAPVGHRHGAEVEQAWGLQRLHLSITAIDTVRGASASVQLLSTELPDERGLWSLWRDAVADEPFLGIVHERGGAYRHPDPKTLTGSNRADLGWALDAEAGRLVAFAAIDNLGKGAAGSALQSLNLMCGYDESAGLDHPMLWPA